MGKNTKIIWMLILTPVMILLTHAIAYLFHEYSHSFSAWILGYKANPFALNYGEANLKNILLLYQVSENVDYAPIILMHPYYAAFIAFAGAGVGNVSLFLISWMVLRLRLVTHIFWRYFWFWLIVMNVGNFIDYVPIRTFATHGDIQGIESILNISPWWIMVILGYPVFFCVRFFYTNILPDAYTCLALNKSYHRATLLIFSSIVLFIFFGLSGLNNYGEISHFLSLLSVYITPLVIAVYWPKSLK